MNRKAISVVCIVLVCLWATIAGGSKCFAEQKVIKIGAHLPLSGPTAFTGALNKQGIDLAVDIINHKYPGLTLPLAATAGIPSLGGAKIEVIYADDKGDPNVALAQVERLIQEEHVVAILGGWQSSCIKTGSMVAERLKTPYVSGAGSSVDLTQRGFKYFFRICAHSGKVAKAYFDCLRDMQKKMGTHYKTVAVAYESSEYGSVCNEQIKREVKARGLKLVADIPFDSRAASVNIEVARIKAANPDIFLQIGYAPDAILFTKTMKTINYSPPVWFGMAGYLSNKYISSVGKAAADGVLISGWFSPDFHKPVTEAVAKIFKAHYGQQMTAASAMLFMGPIVLADAINRAGSTNKDAIMKALEKTKLNEQQSIMPGGGVWFSPVQPPPKHSHDNLGAGMLILQIIDGKQQVVWPFQWKTAEAIWPHPAWNK